MFPLGDRGNSQKTRIPHQTIQAVSRSTALAKNVAFVSKAAILSSTEAITATLSVPHNLSQQPALSQCSQQGRKIFPHTPDVAAHTHSTRCV